LEVAPRVLIAVIVLTLGAALLGYLAGAPAPADRRVTGVATALGNPGLALAVIAASFPGFKAAAFVIAYVILRKLALIPFEQWVKHRAHTPPTPQYPTPHVIGT